LYSRSTATKELLALSGNPIVVGLWAASCCLTSKSNAAANAAAFRIIRKEGPRKKGEISIAGGNGKYFILDFYQSFPLMV
jgi:hypothetical protein